MESRAARYRQTKIGSSRHMLPLRTHSDTIRQHFTRRRVAGGTDRLFRGAAHAQAKIVGTSKTCKGKNSHYVSRRQVHAAFGCNSPRLRQRGHPRTRIQRDTAHRDIPSADMNNLAKQNAARAQHFGSLALQHTETNNLKFRNTSKHQEQTSQRQKRSDQSFGTPRSTKKEARSCGIWVKHTVVLTPFEQIDPAGTSHCAKGCHQRITKTSQHNTHKKTRERKTEKTPRMKEPPKWSGCRSIHLYRRSVLFHPRVPSGLVTNLVANQMAR
jgi:hypothetical protein